MYRDIWEAVPYGYRGNVSFTTVGDGFLHVPKRHQYINLKFEQPFYPNNPIFILEMRVEALGLFIKQIFQLVKEILSLDVIPFCGCAVKLFDKLLLLCVEVFWDFNRHSDVLVASASAA